MEWVIVIGVVIVLLAIGALLSPDLRANSLTWLVSGLIILGAIGLLGYIWWEGDNSLLKG